VITSFMQVIDKGIQAAVFNRFKDILSITDMSNDTVLFPKEIAMRTIAEKRGKAAVEFINLWREVTNYDWALQRTPVSRLGINLEYDDGTKKRIINVKTVPVHLEYGVWWWTKDYDKYNRCAEKYLFWQQENPNLDVNYNAGLSNYPLEMDLHFGEVSDESTTPDMFDKGLYFVMHAPVIVDGWVFTDSLVRTVKKVVVTVYDNTYTDTTPPILWQEEIVCT